MTFFAFLSRRRSRRSLCQCWRSLWSVARPWQSCSTTPMMTKTTSSWMNWRRLMMTAEGTYLLALTSLGTQVKVVAYLGAINPKQVSELKPIVQVHSRKNHTDGWESYSRGYGRRLEFKRSWVRISAPATRWSFFTLIWFKNCIACFEMTKNKQKEAGVGHFVYKKCS